MRIGIAAFMILVVRAGVQAQESTLAREFSVAAAEALGAAIYRQDLASAIGSDFLVAEVPDPAEAGVLGWITTEDAEGFLVTFVGLKDGQFVALYDVRPSEPAPSALRDADERSLSDLELTLFLARMTALRHPGVLCSSAFNAVILPDPESDSWLVYLLAVTQEAGVIPFGGHHRITVSADGTEVLANDQLFVTCQALNVAEAIQDDAGEPGEIHVVQDVGRVPLETSVFLNLLVGLDFSIVTSIDGNEWKLRQGEILSAGEAADFL